MAQLTVASFNTHWGVDHAARPFDAVTPSLALDADVLVLQEVWRPNGGRSYVDEIAERSGAEVHESVFLSDHAAKPRHLQLPSGPAGTCGLAVLSRLPILDVGDIELPHALGDVIQHRHGIVMTVSVEGTPVTIGAMHASHRLWGSLPQVSRIDRAVLDTGHPSLIVGDMNMWGPVVGLVLRDRTRAVLGRTWPARFPHSQIDHVWIDNQIAAIEGGVRPATGSDHRPIWARLKVL